MYKPKDQDSFFEATNSLKKYRRADLVDKKGNTLINKLYVDPLPNNQVFKSCLSDNTTFLIGRKGTGKSTIILRLESEYRKNKEYLCCYIDTKTMFESAKSEYKSIDYLSNNIPTKALTKYLIERTFIQSVLLQVINNVEDQFNTKVNKLKELIGLNRVSDVQRKLKELLNQIKKNEQLESIELPMVMEVNNRIMSSSQTSTEDSESISIELEAKKRLGASISAGKKTEDNASKQHEWENEFPKIFLNVFQINNIIQNIKDILSEIGVKHLIIFLDDFSEIEESSLKTFVDVVLAPLNNWSNEFIKFKIAAYPGRVHYGDIDKGKIDIIDLDFYNLYSEFDRNTMEERAIDFTKRLIDSRINHFSNHDTDYYFDTKGTSMDEYYTLIFQISMNVPRIIGYILFYCYQSNILHNIPINKKALESAAQKYYERVISSFFEKTTYSLISYDEKINSLQQKELLNVFTENLRNIRRRIITRELTGAIYKSTSTNPYTSHFYFPPGLEQFIKTLELNFFISKYNEMSDRDGRKVSIYSINYGLAEIHNLKWGKPTGTAYRKYFIARSFDFTKKIEYFLRKAKKIVCINPDCQKTYSYDKIEFLEFNKMKCTECQSPVRIKSLSESITKELEKIDKSKLLPSIEFSILHELHKNEGPMYAKEIAEELDVSSQLIAGRARKLDLNYQYIKRSKPQSTYQYEITDKANNEYFV